MTTTCGAYHLEALRRQQVLDRKQVALQRLAQKEVSRPAPAARRAGPAGGNHRDLL